MESSWLPSVIAVATVIGNAAVMYSAVSRHERRLDDHDKTLIAHGEAIAGLKAVSGKESPQ
jgi:hypothetical protein